MMNSLYAQEMKSGPVELENLFWDELHACTTAAHLVEKFNKLKVCKPCAG